MALGSGIEWTESTWNPVTGCNKISPGCKYCYAERIAERLQAMGQPTSFSADGPCLGHRHPRPVPLGRRRVLLQAVGWQEQEEGGPFPRRAHVGRDAGRTGVFTRYACSLALPPGDGLIAFTSSRFWLRLALSSKTTIRIA